MDYRKMTDLDKAKINNSICPYDGEKLLSLGWSHEFLVGDKLNLVCSKCERKYSILNSYLFGRSIDEERPYFGW